MKALLCAGVIAVTLNVPLIAADSPPPSSATTPAAAPGAGAAWDKISSDFQALRSSNSSDPAVRQKLMATLFGESSDFITKYPDDPHAASATMLWAQLGAAMNSQNIAGAPSEAEIAKKLDAIATNPKLPKEERAMIRVSQIGQTLQRAVRSNDGAAFDDAEKRFDAFSKEFGDDFAPDGKRPVVPMLREQELSVLSQNPDPARYNALVKKLAASSNPQLVALAKQAQDEQQHKAELKSKPIDLKFTAVDGTAVDLAKMRGKVVLIDFWATWCPPCREEVPNVVAAYQKYHGKGFEIVGISLDQDKDKLLAFTQEKGMVWPQYFDGKGWQNQISQGYGINSIPAMWLVDKKGMLVTTEGREDLAGQVEKLLAAP